MVWQAHTPLKVLARAGSLRRRVAYSLAIVRLILIPVIILATYYLFRMGWIVDRIVTVDAPTATLAQQASIEMLEARRAERNYFLLHDPAYLQANRESVARVQQILGRIRDLQPEEHAATQKALDETQIYQQRLQAVVSRLEEPGQAPTERVRAVVRAYEKDLDELLKHAGRRSRAKLIDDVRKQVGSFDAQITETVQAGSPDLRQATTDLQASSQATLRLASGLETRSWKRVQQGHQQTHQLVRRAEWVLGIVSFLTLVVSVWVSYVLPRQVVRPLIELKEAVDHATAGNYQIEFDFQGEGEVVQLANSVRSLIAHVREKL